jgi:predicted ATPase
VTSIEEVCEHRVKLTCAADVPPDELCPGGEVAALSRRADSRLIEMQKPLILNCRIY